MKTSPGVDRLGWEMAVTGVTVSVPTSAGWYWQLQGSQYHCPHQQSGAGSYRGHSITANISRVVLAVTGVTVSLPSSAEWYWQLQGSQYHCRHQQCGTCSYRGDAGSGEQSSSHWGRQRSLGTKRPHHQHHSSSSNNNNKKQSHMVADMGECVCVGGGGTDVSP